MTWNDPAPPTYTCALAPRGVSNWSKGPKLNKKARPGLPALEPSSAPRRPDHVLDALGRNCCWHGPPRWRGCEKKEEEPRKFRRAIEGWRPIHRRGILRSRPAWREEAGRRKRGRAVAALSKDAGIRTRLPRGDLSLGGAFPLPHGARRDEARPATPQRGACCGRKTRGSWLDMSHLGLMEPGEGRTAGGVACRKRSTDRGIEPQNARRREPKNLAVAVAAMSLPLPL